MATLDDAKSFLGQHYAGRARAVEPLGAGLWSSAFGFVLDGRKLVLRLGQWREDFERDRDAQVFARPGLPVPEVLDVGEREGGAYAVSVRHDGTFLEQLDPSTASWLRPAVFGLLDALREAPAPEGAAGSGFGGRAVDSWSDFLGPPLDEPGARVGGWRPRIECDADLADLYRRTEREIRAFVGAGICPEMRHVLHLDLVNRNVLVDEHRREVAAVFDWGCLAYGDFVYEVAYLAFWEPWFPVLAALDLAASAPRHWREIGLEVPEFAGRFHAYQLHVGLTHLASSAAKGSEEDLVGVARRTSELLAAGPPAG
jgi:aminoglycoside phosphotransferase (APT) family kinase protein